MLHILIKNNDLFERIGVKYKTYNFKDLTGINEHLCDLYSRSVDSFKNHNDDECVIIKNLLNKIEKIIENICIEIDCRKFKFTNQQNSITIQKDILNLDQTFFDLCAVDNTERNNNTFVLAIEKYINDCIDLEEKIKMLKSQGIICLEKKQLQLTRTEISIYFENIHRTLGYLSKFSCKFTDENVVFFNDKIREFLKRLASCEIIV